MVVSRPIAGDEEMDASFFSSIKSHFPLQTVSSFHSRSSMFLSKTSIARPSLPLLSRPSLLHPSRPSPTPSILHLPVNPSSPSQLLLKPQSRPTLKTFYHSGFFAQDDDDEDYYVSVILQSFADADIHTVFTDHPSFAFILKRVSLEDRMRLEFMHGEGEEMYDMFVNKDHGAGAISLSFSSRSLSLLCSVLPKMNGKGKVFVSIEPLWKNKNTVLNLKKDFPFIRFLWVEEINNFRKLLKEALVLAKEGENPVVLFLRRTV